jgi:hypothetical protein
LIPAPPQPEKSNPNLAAALSAALERVPLEQVDQVWIFPPHSHGAKESGLAVLAVFAAATDDPRRTLFTVRYEAESVKGVVQRADLVQEEGTVPRDRLDRLVDGIVRRLGGGLETPDIRDIGGVPEQWALLVGELGGAG